MDWEDIIAVGMGELGFTDVGEMFKLSWVEWDYRIEHYRITNARDHWEPLRELYALVAAMGSEKPKSARELIPLLTDEVVTVTKTGEKEETNQELWARLVGSTSTPSPLTPRPSNEKIMMD